MTLLAVGDVELCVEAFGDPDRPPVVLVSGAAASMDWWPADLCRLLADGGRHVVRYDHRDTGGSTTGPAGAPGYDGDALARDLEGLLEALRRPAHLVGISMGGGIAQVVALRRPDLLASLTLMATSAVGGASASDPPAPALQERFAAPPPDPDWSDRQQVVEWLLDAERAFAGPLGIDEDDVRAAAGSAFDRSRDIAAAGNHWLVVGGEGDEGEGDEGEGDEGAADRPLDVRRIDLPTLVVHGSHDPLFPVSHGRTLAASIPGARLLVVEGMGHQVPPRRTWPVVVPAILDLTRSPADA